MGPTLNRRTARLLQAVTLAAGVTTLVLLLWEPHLEGRNVHATPFEIYFHDPFLAYVYAGALPFFAALRRAFRLFGEAGRTGTFSCAAVEDLHGIRRCALALLGFVAGAVAIVILFGHHEDRPAGFVMCLLASLGAGTLAAVAGQAARKLRTRLGSSAGDRG